MNADFEAVAEFFDGRDCRAAISSADNIVDSGLCHAALDGERVDREIPLQAEFQDPLSYSLSDLNAPAPLSLLLCKERLHNTSCQGYPF